MPGFSIELKGLDSLAKTLTTKPLHASLRLRLAEKMTGLQRDVKTIVGQHYSIMENIDKVSFKSFDRNTKKQITGFQLIYKYQKVPLSRYPVHQMRTTVQKRFLEVKRTRRGSFNARVHSTDQVVWTFIKVKKTWKLVTGKHGPDPVKGRPGYMGWLHTGKLGRKRFRSAGIYERAQAQTWSEGIRLPVFELYGPSFTEILMDREVIDATLRSKSFRDLETYLLKRVSING